MVFARRRVFLDHGNPHSRTGDIVRHRRICDLPPPSGYATARSLRKDGHSAETQRRSGFSGKFGDTIRRLGRFRVCHARDLAPTKRQRVASNSLGSPQTVAPVLDGDAGLHVHRPTWIDCIPFPCVCRRTGISCGDLGKCARTCGNRTGQFARQRPSRQNCGISRTLVGPGGSGSDRLGFASIDT